MSILKLMVAVMCPAIISGIFTLLDKKTKFKDFSYASRQIIIGVAFGIFAVLSTEYGVDIGGAILNVRDSAPLCAGLLFGGPAGMIAGVIGGVERWLCVYWGGAQYTRLACSVATLFAGLFAALLRKRMFDNKRPTFGFMFGFALVTEVFHMLLVLVTNMSDMSYAFEFVRQCTTVMTLCNGLAVSFAYVAAGERIFEKLKPRPLIRDFTKVLFISVVGAFVVTGSLTYLIHTEISSHEAGSLLEYNADDICAELKENGLSKRLASWRTGQTGGLLICNKSGRPLIASRAGKRVSSLSDWENCEINLKDACYKTSMGGEKVYCLVTETEDYYVFVFTPVKEADLFRNVTLYMSVFMEIIIYVTIFCIVYQIMKRKMVDRLHEVNAGLNDITYGKLDTVIDVRTCREFSDLSDDINKTVDTLKEHISEAEKRIDRELELARQIQKSAVPFIFPPFPKRKDFDIYALMNTAKEVGGDFYDFYFTDDKHFAFLIADVSGKGIPAAMFMMASKTLIKGLAERGKTVDEVFNETNEKLCRNNDAGMFVTAWMGAVNLETGHMAYANAGHNPPLICKNNGEFQYLKSKPNFILAGMEETRYRKYEMTLYPGDVLFLYTDGITEASDINGKFYGEDKLLRSLLSVKERSPKMICKTVESDTLKFAGSAPQADDMTMLSFRLNYMQSANSITVYPDIKSLHKVSEFLSEKLSMLNISKSVLNKIQVSVDEIYSNIMKFSSADFVKIKFLFANERLSLVFTDNGRQYDPTAAESPDITLSAQDRKIGGLGIFMVKNLASRVQYEYKNSENMLTVDFNLKDAEK